MRSVSPPGFGLDDQQQLHVALGAELGERLEQGGDALHRRVRAGHRHDAAGHAWLGRRPEHVVDAERHDPDAGPVDAEVGDDVARRALGRAQHDADAAGHPALHAQEAVPPAQGQPATPGRGGREVDAAVEGDRVVDGRDDGEPGPLDREDAVGEGLVVVHDVEVTEPRAQQPGDPEAEGARLGEAGGPHRRDLEDVDRVADLREPRGAERVGLAVEVEAGHLGQPHPLVEDRVGLAGEHLDVVAEGGQLTGQVSHVDALTAAVRLAAVGQQGDAQPGLHGNETCSRYGKTWC